MGVPHLFQDDINRFPIPLPSIDEQEKIIAFIEVNTRSLDILQSQAEHAIELLKERRSALISAAVTGKFFVGKVAEKNKKLMSSLNDQFLLQKSLTGCTENLHSDT